MLRVTTNSIVKISYILKMCYSKYHTYFQDDHNFKSCTSQKCVTEISYILQNDHNILYCLNSNLVQPFIRKDSKYS